MSDLVIAIKQLREQLGESQQAFATRLGLSVRAIANYEAGRKPTPAVLAQLAQISYDFGTKEVARVFTRSYREACGSRLAGCTAEEQALVRMVLYLARNKHLVPNWYEIRLALLTGIEAISADKSGTRMTNAEDIATALEEGHRLVARNTQERITKLARERAKKTSTTFWAAYEDVIATHPHLQRELLKDIEQDSQKDEKLASTRTARREKK